MHEKDREHQERLEWKKRRMEDLFTEKRKAQRLEAEYTYSDCRNEGMAAYYKSEVQQIELLRKTPPRRTERN